MPFLNSKDAAQTIQEFNDVVLAAMDIAGGYTTLNSVIHMTGYQRLGARNGMARLCEYGYAKEHKVRRKDGRRILIWGITKMGRIVHRDIDENSLESPEMIGWSINQFNALYLEHTEQMQRAFTQLRASGEVRFYFKPQVIDPEFNPNKNLVGGRKPDLTFDLNGTDYAVEIELTRKSDSRYRGILGHYKNQKAACVWYCSQKAANALEPMLEVYELNELHKIVRI